LSVLLQKLQIQPVQPPEVRVFFTEVITVAAFVGLVVWQSETVC